jgi:hypothetical protein
MRKMCAWLVVLLPISWPISCFAETPFAGTWVVQPQATEYSLRPLSFMIERGTYKRASCAPDVEVPTDGQEHALDGDPLVQTMSVRLMDAHRVEVAQKIGGRLVWKGSYTVAKDQKSMTLAYEDHRATNAVSARVQFARDGETVPNAHLLSGTWKAVKLLDLSSTGLTMTIEGTDNGLRMNASDGRAYDIKFDRHDYPLTGYLEGATVQVGLRRPTTLQVNRKQHGAYVEMSLGQLSDDGQSMQLSQRDWQCQSLVTWTLRKQSPPQSTP